MKSPLTHHPAVASNAISKSFWLRTVFLRLLRLVSHGSHGSSFVTPSQLWVALCTGESFTASIGVVDVDANDSEMTGDLWTLLRCGFYILGFTFLERWIKQLWWYNTGDNWHQQKPLTWNDIGFEHQQLSGWTPAHTYEQQKEEDKSSQW